MSDNLLVLLLAYHQPPMDFIYLGGHGSSRHVLYLDLSKEDITEFSSQALVSTLAGTEVWLGLLSYDDYASSYLRSTWSPRASQLRKSSTQIWIEAGQLKLGGQPSPAAYAYFQRLIAQAQLYARHQLSQCVGHWFDLRDLDTKQSYLNKVEQIKRDIQGGRYYQLNLLRRFELPRIPNTARLRDSELVWWALMARYFQYAEAMSAIVCLDDETVISFSPERFITIQPRQAPGTQIDYCLEAFPIKGTMPRAAQPHQDHANRARLEASFKDQRELNMIVDLMRNDVSRVSVPGSTALINEGQVVACASVFHRVAHISGGLKDNISWQELFKALLPAGSITGAPKVEVMKAISEYEVAPRGYFMGHIFVADHRGFDSSVLIRTLVHSPSTGAQYAAGSGLVYDSSSLSEYEETQAKCAMWHSG